MITNLTLTLSLTLQLTLTINLTLKICNTWVYIHVALTITGVRVCVTAIISGVRFYSALHGPKIAGPMKLQPYPAQPVKIIKILAWPGPVNRKPSPARRCRHLRKRTQDRQLPAHRGHLLDKNCVTQAPYRHLLETQLFVTVGLYILLILLVIPSTVFNCVPPIFNKEYDDDVWTVWLITLWPIDTLNKDGHNSTCTYNAVFFYN